MRMRAEFRPHPRLGLVARALVLLVVASALVAVGPHGNAARPAAAQGDAQRARELDKLFVDLKSAPAQAEADKIVAGIWDRWMRSGRDDVDVMMTRVIANTAGQHYGLALLLLDEVTELAPDFAEAWNKRAALRYRMGEYAGALDDLEKALNLEPRHFGALAVRSAILADTSKWQEALAAYRAALAINPFLASRHKVVPELERLAAQAQ